MITGPYSARTPLERLLIAVIAVLIAVIVVGYGWVWHRGAEHTVLNMNSYVYQVLEREGR